MDIKKDLMSVKEFNELEAHINTLSDEDRERCGDAHTIFIAFKNQRHASNEFAHRWAQVAALLCDAKCPANCSNKTCAWCYDRGVELSAFDSYKQVEKE